MKIPFRVTAVALLLAAFTTPALAQPKDKPIPEPLPMGVPYVYQPGNNYWYAPVVPAYGTVWVAPVATRAGAVYVAPVVYPYPFASSGPVYGRYAWDYTGAYSSGYGWYATNLPHYPYSYQYPTLAGRVWMGYGW
ncbi:MAG: hypothetical protein J0I06_02755 [Planctomycetes bacterium]|nr:hypothetical protein [Planctomycetota bacterium]